MSKDLFKILKELKDIEPDQDYSKRSRNLLLSEIEINKRGKTLPRFMFSDVLSILHPSKFVLGMVSVAVLILIISGGVYYAIRPLSQDDLVVKASEANASIQVKLNEIQYLLESHAPTDSNQILAIQDMLQNVTDNLKAAASLEPQNIEGALERIKAAEDALYQIDQLIK